MTLNFSKRNSLSIIAMFTLIIAFFAWHSKNFRVDASADTLLMKGNEHYLTSQEAGQTYNASEFILIAFKPNSGSIFSNDTLSLIQELSNKLKTIERANSIRSLVNVPIFVGEDSLSADLNPNALTWAEKQYPTQEMDRLLSSHPLYEGLLFNDRKTATAIQITFKAHPELERIEKELLKIQKIALESDLSEQQKSQLERLKSKKDEITSELNRLRSEEITKIRAIVSQYKSQGEFFLGGGNLLADQLIKIIKSDLLIFGSLISAIICILLYVLFGQLRWVLLPVASCAASVIITIGFLGLTGLKVTVISANVIALQIILTLAIIVHLIVQYNECIKNNGQRSQSDLVNDTVKSKIKPCFYAGLTTSVGFGSLIFSGVAPVISFGWMMVVAMIVTLLVSLLFFPALIAGFSNSVKVGRDPKLVKNFMGLFANLSAQHPLMVMIFSFLICALGVVGCLKLTAENSFLNYFSESTDVYRELSFIDKEFGGSTPLDILYTIPSKHTDENLIITAESVKIIDNIHNTLEKHEAIGSITSLADFATIATVTLEKPLTEYEITALYRTLDEDLQEQLFGAYFSADKNQTRISARIQDTTEGLDRAELVENLRNDIENLGIAPSRFELTNLFILYQDILARLVKSQFTTLALVYAAMAIILIVVFKSVKTALICLVPNVITTAAIMGIMGWLSIPLDLMTITIAAVAMGISVDDTIHYTHRFQNEGIDGDNNVIRKTHLSVGYALLYTTLIIVIGFSSLMLSDFVPSILFGALTGVAMIVAFATDVTILPVLLKRYTISQKNEG